MPRPHSYQSRRPSSGVLSDYFRRAQRHEDGALQQLLVLYRPLLLKLANQKLKRSLRRKLAPSDLVQITELKATNGFYKQHFEERLGFKAWLITILSHEVVNARRRFLTAKKRDVRRERPLFSPEARRLLNRLSESRSGASASASERNDTVEQLLAAFKRLPPHYQLVLRLRYFEKLSFEAIGEKLDRKYDAARVLHNRALKKLRAELDKLRDDNASDSHRRRDES